MNSKKKTKFQNLTSGSQFRTEIPGIISLEDGFYLSTDNLPSSDHFFMSTDFAIEYDNELFNILFGQKSSFSNKGKYKLAIEVSMPIDSAVKFLYYSIWKTPRIGDKERPFIETIQEVANNKIRAKTNKNNEILEIPDDPNCYRKFPSNFVTSSISEGQGMVEFFEASPETMVNLVHNRILRPNSGVKNIVSVLMAPSVMLKFYTKAEEVLRPMFESLDFGDK